MASLLKKFHHTDDAQAEIHLSSRSGDGHFSTNPNHFLSNETVHGYAHITLPAGTQISHSRVTLKGAIKTTTDDTHKGAVGKSWRTERLPFLGVMLQNKQRTLSPKDGLVRIPFQFDLGQCERLSTIGSLPASLDSKSEGQRSTDCQFQVDYSVGVTAFSPKGVLASTTHKIHILPVSSTALSERHSDVPNEYFWARPTSKQTKTSSEPRIEVIAEEPDPIVFDAYHRTPEGSTELLFMVKAVHSNPDPAGRASGPCRCQVKARLVTKTHITPDGKRRVHSESDRMRDLGERTTKTHVSHEQENTVFISNWESSIPSTTDPFSVAKFSMPFSVRDSKPLVPTFSTNILARDYAIDLTISFPDLPQQSYKLSLDVAVVQGVPETIHYESGKESKSPYICTEARL